MLYKETVNSRSVVFHSKSVCHKFRFWTEDYLKQNICVKRQKKVTISSIIHWCYYTTSYRQYYNCCFRESTSSAWWQNWTNNRNNTHRSITSSWDLEGCLFAEYLLYLYWDNLSLFHWWCTKPSECNLYGHCYLFCFNLPLVFFNLTIHINYSIMQKRLIVCLLTSITFHVVTSDLFIWQRKNERVSGI